MKLNDTLLLAWVDGELSERDSTEVERLVAESPEAQATVEALAASRLPYQDAFARQALPEVPASLTAHIALLTSAAERYPATPAHITLGARTSGWMRRRPGTWAGVAFVTGMVCAATGMQFWPAPKAPWISAVAQYQEMYVRATLEDIKDNPADSNKTLLGIKTQDQIAVAIPDLSGASYEFKRVQRLQYDGKPIVQMVYLPHSGEPIALCATPDMRGDAPITQRAREEVNMITWRSGHVGYVLLGRTSPEALKQLGKQLQEGKLPALYS